MSEGKPYKRAKTTGQRSESNYGVFDNDKREHNNMGTRYPTSLLEFPSTKHDRGLHRTQKPVALMEYLIKTYTKSGDVVLDNCMGP